MAALTQVGINDIGPLGDAVSSINIKSTKSSESTGRSKKMEEMKTAELVEAIEAQQVDELGDTDDWASAWKDCLEQGKQWGGRGFGGRAAGRQTLQTRDVFIEGCTMAYLGTNLLERTTFRLMHKRRYGLIGRNGVGKSTLMRRIATCTLPGFPPHLRVAQVQQELPVVDRENPITPVQYVINNDPLRKSILRKIDELEGGGECSSPSTPGAVDIAVIEAEAELLQQLYDALEEEGVATARAVRVLKELGFGPKKRDAAMHSLSGGWRMRVAIATALAQEPDILLLDEPTNHLDLEGTTWLKSYLLGPMAEDITVLVTSHDSGFLDDVCTDIIRLFNRQLKYYPGNYTAYELAHQEKELSMQRTQEGIDRQRKHLEDSIRKMQAVASRDSTGKGSSQVSSRKKKLSRVGAEKNEKGFRFRAQQDSTFGMSSIRAGSMNETAMGNKTGDARCLMEAAEREWKMTLPDPVPLPILADCSCLQLRAATMGFSTIDSPIHTATDTTATAAATATSTATSTDNVAMTASAIATATASAREVACKGSLGTKKLQAQRAARSAAASDAVAASNDDVKVILENITLDLNQHSKIAIVGKNGCGKSTLMKLIHLHGDNAIHSKADRATDISASPLLTAGEILKHHNLRTAYFQQHQQECLPYAMTPIEFLQSSSPPEDMQSEQALRAHLGTFGLSGALALQQIGKLSGGQKARVVLAELTMHRPHMLLLDEPTNNLDMDSIRALRVAISSYQGACIVASHDMAFIQGSCADVVVYQINKGHLLRLEGGVQEYKDFVASTVEQQRRMNK